MGKGTIRPLRSCKAAAFQPVVGQECPPSTRLPLDGLEVRGLPMTPGEWRSAKFTGEHTGVHRAHSQYTEMALRPLPDPLTCQNGVISANLPPEFLQNQVGAIAKFAAINELIH